MYSRNDNVPEKVMHYINIQIRRLTANRLFSYQDKDDLCQEFILYYLENLASKKASQPDAFLFISIKNFASALIRKKMQKKAEPLFVVSIDGMTHDISDLGMEKTLEDFENKETVSKIMSTLSPKEKDICLMIMGGVSINEISRSLKMAKKTIYKILERIQKIYRF